MKTTVEDLIVIETHETLELRYKQAHRKKSLIIEEFANIDSTNAQILCMSACLEFVKAQRDYEQFDPTWQKFIELKAMQPSTHLDPRNLIPR